jgi:hypothetical protein
VEVVAHNDVSPQWYCNARHSIARVATRIDVSPLHLSGIQQWKW